MNAIRYAAALVAVAAMTPLGFGQLPTIQIVDNADGTASLEIVTSVDGALAAELALELVAAPGLVLTGATINTALFDDANPGDNPFIPGLPIGGDTTGLGLDLANNRLFASYGSGPLGVGAFTFLDFTYSGSGTVDAFGLVAQGGVLNDGLSTSTTLGGGTNGPGPPMIFLVDNGDGTVTLQVETSQPGSLGAELSVSLMMSDGVALTDAIVNTALFDTPNPGDNPFIPGSPLGGDTTGLFTDFQAGEVFASFGSGDLGVGTFDFMTLSFEGQGTIDAFGFVAQGGQLGDFLLTQVSVVPEPGALASLATLGFAAVAARRRLA